MPAAYAISRQRTLRGMGATYFFRPRLRGIGQDITPPDIGTNLPSLGPSAPLVPAGAQPSAPFVYGNPAPIQPAPVITAAIPPSFGPTPAPVQFVFPSSGPVPPPGYTAAAAAPGASWFSQQMISGIPNSYLALGTVGLVLLFSMSSAKRRR